MGKILLIHLGHWINICHSQTVPTNCEYVDRPGTYLPFTDTYISFVTDIEECRAQCSSQGQYNCRSFNYNAFRKVGTPMVPILKQR